MNLEAVGKLIRLAELAREFRSEYVAEKAATLAQRLTEGSFYVAGCMGQFKPRNRSYAYEDSIVSHFC